MKHIAYAEVPAKQIALEVKGGVEVYARALLAIFNNVRDSRRLYNVTNDEGNTIFVTCTPESVKDAEEWLSQWGEIEAVEDVVVFDVDTPDYDYHKYADALIRFAD